MWRAEVCGGVGCVALLNAGMCGVVGWWGWGDRGSRVLNVHSVMLSAYFFYYFLCYFLTPIE